jgi:hypothetical protein
MSFVRLTKQEEYRLTPSEKLVLFYRAHPVEACKDLLGIELIWIQRIMLRSMWTNKYILLLLSRGIGKTYLMAVFCALYAMLYPGVMIGVIAPTFKQTEFFFDKLVDIHENSPYLRACCPKIQRTSYKCLARFNNGAFIEGLPLGTGQSVRGRRYNIIVIDEYASVDEDIINSVVMPMMNVKKKGIENKSLIAGTAYYAWNHFYLKYLAYHVMSHKEPDLYALHEYIFEDVTMVPDAPFELDKDAYEMMRLGTTDEIYQMEHFCRFPVENVGFFSSQMLDRCTPKATETTMPCPIEVTGENNDMYVMGIDAARVAGGDNFSISIIKIKNHTKQFVHGFILNGAPYQEMIRHIRRLCTDFNIARINLDAGGGGTTIKDLLSESYSTADGRVYQPILDMDDKDTIYNAGLRMLRLTNFTRQTVNDLYMRLKSDIQHKTIEFPIDMRRSSDRALEKIAQEILETKRELLVIQAEPKGNFYSFSVPSQFKKDRATSLVLANQAANDLLDTVKNRVELAEIGEGFWVN